MFLGYNVNESGKLVINQKQVKIVERFYDEYLSRKMVDYVIVPKGSCVAQRGPLLLRIGIYIYNIDAFNRLEAKKELLEKIFGYNIEWYTSRKNSTAKRVLYSITTDLYNKENYNNSFTWLIDCFDKLKNALESLD